MPQYQVTSPTGQKFVVTAPETASQADILAYAQKQMSGQEKAPAPSKPSKPWSAADIIGAPLGVGEAVLEAPLGAVAKDASQAIASPIAGAVSALRGKGFEKGFQEENQGLENAAQKLFAPQTRMGQELSSAISKPFGFLGKASDYVGKKVSDITGSQAAGSEAKSLANLGEAVGLGKIGMKAPDVLRQISEATPIKNMTPTERATLSQAHKAGFVVPPSYVKTSKVGSLMEGIGGKAKVEQAARLRNAEITDKLAKQELKIPEHQDLTADTIQAARQPYLQVYQKIAQLPGAFKATNAYLTRIQSLGSDLMKVAKEHPDIVNVDNIKKIQQSLSATSFSPQVAMTLIRQLRSDASATLDRTANLEKPSAEQVALGKAQRGAADAMEKMVQANLRASGNAQLYKDFKDARRYIAVSHDVEKAVNPANGHIDPNKLRRMDEAAGNKRMSGNLKTIVRFAQAFPKAMGAPEKIGGVPMWSPLDTMAGIGTALATHDIPLTAAAMARPALRKAALSKPIQAGLVKP